MISATEYVPLRERDGDDRFDEVSAVLRKRGELAGALSKLLVFVHSIPIFIGSGLSLIHI